MLEPKRLVIGRNVKYLMRKFDCSIHYLSEEINVEPFLIIKIRRCRYLFEILEHTSREDLEQILVRISNYFFVPLEWIKKNRDWSHTPVFIKNSPLNFHPLNEQKKRKCLRCNQKFMSLSSENRLCGECKKVKIPQYGDFKVRFKTPSSDHVQRSYEANNRFNSML